MPNQIQSGEHSMDGAKDGIGYNPSWTDPGGLANFPYVNSDGNSNFNWVDNDFNDNWRWLVRVSNFRSFPAPCAGFSFFIVSYQGIATPLSILPTFSRSRSNVPRV